MHWEDYMYKSNPACTLYLAFIVCFCYLPILKSVPEDTQLFIHSQSSQLPQATCISRSHLKGQTVTKTIWGTNKEHRNKQLCLSLSVSLPNISLYVTGRHGAQTALTHLSFELSEKSQSSYFQLSMFSAQLQACYLCI